MIYLTWVAVGRSQVRSFLLGAPYRKDVYHDSIVYVDEVVMQPRTDVSMLNEEKKISNKRV